MKHTRGIREIKRGLGAFILSMGLCILISITAFGAKGKKHVLFISSYSESFSTVPLQISGIQNIFQDENVELDIEYMDTRRFDTKDNRELFYKLIQYKLSNTHTYDAVITGDDAALEFVMEHQEELFYKVPIIFLGVNNFETAEKAYESPYMTGIIEETSLKENVEIAKKFNRNAVRVVGIVDSTLTGIGDQKQFLETAKEFPELEFDLLNTEDYSYEEFGKVIEGIGDDTILLYLTMFRDKLGDSLTIDESVELLKEYARIPVYRATIGGVGQGLIGGNMVSYEKSGELAASMVLDILDGTPVSDIEMIRTSPNQYFFDYEILKKYDINMNLVPSEAVLVNKKETFLDQNKELATAIGVGSLFLVVVIAILVTDKLLRVSIEKALKESYEELSLAHEELAASEEELRTQFNIIRDHAEEMELLNQKYEISIKSTETAVWEVDTQQKTIMLSGIPFSTLGKEEVLVENLYTLLRRLLEKEDRKKILNHFKEGFNDGEELNLCVSIRISKEDKRWMLVKGKGVTDLNNKVVMVYGILLDITKMKEQEQYIEYLAHHDHMTGLPNRMTFMNLLQKNMDSGRAGTVFILDIDNFKNINDSMGHIYGDMLLKKVGERLSWISDDKLFVSRFGGDEFLILLADVEDISEIENYAKKIKNLFKTSLFVGGKENFISISMGISRFPMDGKDMDQLITNADTAMYRVKRSGKNDYLFYHEEMQTALKDKNEMEVILRTALKEDGFKLLYQPQVSSETGEIVAFEALLRLKAFNIPPYKFISVAEETGLILEIGRWVTKEAIRQLKVWKEKGFKEKTVGINFSSKQIEDVEYLEFLSKTLEEYKIAPEYVEIEITESILLEKSEKTLYFLEGIKKLGVLIALDDFGTGFSSLNYLTYIPVDKIKLDKSLSDRFLEYKNDKLIDSLIFLAHSLEMEIVAEGIEKWSQFYRLKESKCDYIQGFLFSKPISAEEAEELYNRNMLENNIV